MISHPGLEDVGEQEDKDSKGGPLGKTEIRGQSETAELDKKMGETVVKEVRGIPGKALRPKNGQQG